MKNLKNYLGKSLGIAGIVGASLIFSGCGKKKNHEKDYNYADKVLMEYLTEKVKERENKIEFYKNNYQEMLDFLKQECECSRELSFKDNFKFLGSYKFDYPFSPLVCFYIDSEGKNIYITEQKDNTTLNIGEFKKYGTK